MKKAIAWVVGIVVFFGVATIGFVAQREAHYKLGYEAKVRETVHEMVRPECIKP